MSNARNISSLSTVEVGATADQTKADLNAIGVSGGRKNLIINGGMQVSQRGSSSTSNGYVSLDRWYSNQSGASTTFSQETNANPSETGGINSYARLNVSSSSDYTGIRQRIEDVTSVTSGVVTLSFWAKGTAPTGGLYITCGQDFGTSGSADVDLAAVQITASLTSSWVKYSTPITIPSIDGKTINAGSFFNMSINQGTNTSSTAYDLNITGVQLELGSVATDFEHRSYGEELALCQRYYENIQDQPSGSETLIGVGFGYTGDRVMANYKYQVEKRVAPSVTHVGSVGSIQCLDGAGTNWYSSTALSYTINHKSTRIFPTVSGIGGGEACEMRIEPGLVIHIDAEL